MKLLVTKNEYKESNLTLHVSEDLSELSAYGYDWFRYLSTDKVGNIILSEYSSQSSKKHIGSIETVLNRHSLKVSLRLDFINNYSESFNRSICAIHDIGHYGHNLTSIECAIKREIKLIKNHISLLIDTIKTPRSHKSKNEQRKNEIKNCLYRIKDLRNFKNNFLDKKVKKVKFNNECFLLSDWTKNENKVFNDIYGNYLKCKDSRQVKFYLNNFKVKRAWLYHNSSNGVPLRLEKLCKLFGLNKNYDFSKIVFYPFIQDVNDSIPSDENSIEFNEFLKMIKRLKVNKENLNSLQLDKIHTATINRNNRAEKTDYTPRAWVAYSVNEKLLSLENEINKDKKILSVIKNQGDLKKESRKMSHCIGHKDMGYHAKILNKGYQALNYKDYTFFLNPDLSINETHGRHNSSTPDYIRIELEKLLNQ